MMTLEQIRNMDMYKQHFKNFAEFGPQNLAYAWVDLERTIPLDIAEDAKIEAVIDLGRWEGLNSALPENERRLVPKELMDYIGGF